MTYTPTKFLTFLVGESYVQQQFRLGEYISSPIFPELQLQLDQIVPRQ